jgi:hypothetical protein
MNRALVFPLLGPMLVVLEVWLVTDLALGIPVVFIGYLVTALLLLPMGVCSLLSPNYRSVHRSLS